ncbi:unnamed protein product [Orchesella dallaii]|uniref:Ergosterol biosynthetic protein 28 n=1 Tax=Orchesella dallaii TaxID=48710 RepID=A0ABP1RD83_9HEXA
MVHAVIYCMRGWIAFVAFIEFGNAAQCFIDEKQFLSGHIFIHDDNEPVTTILARTMGRYCLLNAVIMTHCALCIDHIPIIVLSILTLSLNILMYGSEAFYYYSAPVNFYICFPIAIALLTIICLLIAPVFLEPELRRQKQIVIDSDEEEEDEYEMYSKQKHLRTIPPSLPAKIKKNQ